MADRVRIVLAGGAGAMPFAGVGWQVAQYLEGLRRLGHSVTYLEDTRRWPYDPVADTVADDARPAVAWVAAVMERCGMASDWAYRDVATEGTLFGPLGEAALARRLAEADVIVNLSGVTVLTDEMLRVPVRVYLETDPVMPQIEVAQGRAFTVDFLAAHTHWFTYGENLGGPDCAVPTDPRFPYRSTRQPVILDWWATAGPADGGAPLTTVANWRQSGKDIEWQGEILTWSKHVEFARFLDVAGRAALPIELALSPEEPSTFADLRAHGFRVRAARPLSADLDAYRTYLRGSAGEFSVAKEQNVRLRSGWFSDRTAAYLAAGRPAIVQDTAFDVALPTGAGLLAFTTPDEAVAAIAAVAADPARHGEAARQIAADHLRAETVLAALIDAV